MSHVECETPPGARMFEAVCGILDTYDRDPAKLIPILQAVQAQYRYLPEEVLTYVATSLGLPPARVYGVATFYAHFTLEPKGKHVVRVCDGTACHVKGSTRILEGMQKLLGLYATDKTLQLHNPRKAPTSRSAMSGHCNAPAVRRPMIYCTPTITVAAALPTRTSTCSGGGATPFSASACGPVILARVPMRHLPPFLSSTPTQCPSCDISPHTLRLRHG